LTGPEATGLCGELLDIGIIWTRLDTVRLANYMAK